MVDNCFRFKLRWKEELVVSGSAGAFILELPMGVLAVYLPTEDEWASRAPIWARHLWPELKRELEDWCCNNNALLHIDASAAVHSI